METNDESIDSKIKPLDTFEKMIIKQQELKKI